MKDAGHYTVIQTSLLHYDVGGDGEDNVITCMCYVGDQFPRSVVFYVHYGKSRCLLRTSFPESSLEYVNEKVMHRVNETSDE